MNDHDNFDIAVHEAGHATVASHFQVPSFPEILDQGRSVVTQTVPADSTGICSYDESRIRLPPLQFAATCWGGQLAECLYSTPPPWAPQYKPTALLLRPWWSAMLVQLRKFSPTDRDGIVACRQSWRACKIAYRILRKNKTRVIGLARAIAGRIEKPVPMPSAWPGTQADFLRLVVAADGKTGDAAKRYHEFLSDLVKNFWSSGHESYSAALPTLKDHFLNSVTAEIRATHPGKTDAEISQALFDQTFQTALDNKRKRFDQLFENQTGWTSAARSFLAWQKTANSTEKIP